MQGRNPGTPCIDAFLAWGCLLLLLTSLNGLNVQPRTGYFDWQELYRMLLAAVHKLLAQALKEETETALAGKSRRRLQGASRVTHT